MDRNVGLATTEKDNDDIDNAILVYPCVNISPSPLQDVVNDYNISSQQEPEYTSFLLIVLVHKPLVLFGILNSKYTQSILMCNKNFSKKIRTLYMGHCLEEPIYADVVQKNKKYKRSGKKKKKEDGASTG